MVSRPCNSIVLYTYSIEYHLACLSHDAWRQLTDSTLPRLSVGGETTTIRSIRVRLKKKETPRWTST